ncbi:DUF4351 domain-containing protein [Pseudocalidococcus azoricus]|uniref:DUF4351 domain-containing protein n=1 Tax=Pseudocalidococcus azoricus TaxID=3110322 RepID=UPI00389A86D4
MILIKSQIRVLSTEKLEVLTQALLEFQNLSELQAHQQQKAQRSYGKLGNLISLCYGDLFPNMKPIDWKFLLLRKCCIQ